MTAAKTTAARRPLSVRLVPLCGEEFADARIHLGGADTGAVVNEWTSWKTGRPVAYYEVTARSFLTLEAYAAGGTAPVQYYRGVTRDEAVARFAADRAMHRTMVWRRPRKGEVYSDGSPLAYELDREGNAFVRPLAD